MLSKVTSFALFAATIPFANWLIGNVGTTCIPDGPCLVPVGFGYMAPSGVLMIGIALVLRDLVHEVGGAWMSALAVMVGSLLSLTTSSPNIAIASAVAFGVAEAADLAVYTPLRRRKKWLAVLSSGAVGSVVDSILFVWIAFGAVDLAAGTAIAKFYASAIVAAVIALFHSKMLRGA